MGEAFSWMEGQVWISTGVPFATSAYFAYAESTRVTRQIGYVNTPGAGGVYTNHSTGQKADVNIGAAYAYPTIDKYFEAQTAVHMKFVQSTINGSAVLYLYSGRIQSLSVIGARGDVFKYELQAYFNNWSAY